MKWMDFKRAIENRGVRDYDNIVFYFNVDREIICDNCDDAWKEEIGRVEIHEVENVDKAGLTAYIDIS
ncbi:MAG: hypothetical protein ACTSUP_03035 [Candidatus Heimdallarchaeaceae archaeon]